MGKLKKEISKDLLNIFQAAINAVAGKQVVEAELKSNQYNGKYHIIAIGKAADAMVQGVPDDKIINGLVITKHGHFSDQLQQDSRFICVESDHPIPDKASISAGQSLLDYLGKLPPDAPCLFLISGGASALVEVLEDGWTLADLSELSNYLLANAYPIHEINAIRKKISKIKGGGLWHSLQQRPVTCLIISDVPNDNPEDIGSGLLFPSRNEALPELPKKWASRITESPAIEAAKEFDWKIIASLTQAKQAAAHYAEQLNYKVKIIANFLDGKAEDAAKHCLKTIEENPDTLFIWGGETTVILPNNPGKGGRNQHLALAAAIQMDGLENCYLLAAGTDGSDGLSTATGAWVDHQTIAKARQLQLDAELFLQQADSNTFFTETGNLIITGATGTNVMDLVIAIQIKSI